MCDALLAFPAPAAAGARRSADSLVGEQVGEAQGSRQGHQRHHVPHAGASPSLPPAPQRLVVDVETPCNLRPRQPRLLLEPLQPLREVVGGLGRSLCCGGCAVSALRRSFRWIARQVSATATSRPSGNQQSNPACCPSAPAAWPYLDRETPVATPVDLTIDISSLLGVGLSPVLCALSHRGGPIRGQPGALSKKRSPN